MDEKQVSVYDMIDLHALQKAGLDNLERIIQDEMQSDDDRTEALHNIEVFMNAWRYKVEELEKKLGFRFCEW